MESHYEYGTRVAYWRLMKLFDDFSFPATLNVCARSLARSPWIAQDVLRRGHEICSHGVRWEGPVHLTEDQERKRITDAVEIIRNCSGSRPLGWHSRSTATPNTRRLLVENGFTYDSDAYNDDLPYLLLSHGREYVVIPYALDTNDMRFFQGHGFVQSDDFSRYCINAVEWLRHNSESCSKMITIGLHLRIIGRPGRISGLKVSCWNIYRALPQRSGLPGGSILLTIGWICIERGG